MSGTLIEIEGGPYDGRTFPVSFVENAGEMPTSLFAGIPIQKRGDRNIISWGDVEAQSNTGEGFVWTETIAALWNSG